MLDMEGLSLDSGYYRTLYILVIRLCQIRISSASGEEGVCFDRAISLI